LQKFIKQVPLLPVAIPISPGIAGVVACEFDVTSSAEQFVDISRTYEEEDKH